MKAKVSKKNIELMTKIFKTAVEYSLGCEHYACTVEFSSNVNWLEYGIYENGYTQGAENINGRVHIDLMTNYGLTEELLNILDLITSTKKASDERHLPENMKATSAQEKKDKMIALRAEIEELERG